MPKSGKKIAIASDHAGVELKAFLVKNVTGVEWLDLGPASKDSVDYPDYAAKVGEKIQKGEVAKGVLVCGSGIGVSMAANKMAGIRAAHVESVYTARLSGEHNQANVLCLGERVTAAPHAQAMVEAWLSAKFGGEGASADACARHQRRIEKIHKLEHK